MSVEFVQKNAVIYPLILFLKLNSSIFISNFGAIYDTILGIVDV